MNCREVQTRLFADPAGAPDDSRRASLDAHLADCPACRQLRDNLAAGLAHWRDEARLTPVPDAQREWLAVRRQIRADAAPAPRSASRLAWLALPLAAAAAVAILLAPPRQADIVPTAHADSVEAPGNAASTMVFVDDKSGWLIVWASDAVPRQG